MCWGVSTEEKRRGHSCWGPCSDGGAGPWARPGSAEHRRGPLRLSLLRPVQEGARLGGQKGRGGQGGSDRPGLGAAADSPAPATSSALQKSSGSAYRPGSKLADAGRFYFCGFPNIKARGRALRCPKRLTLLPGPPQGEGGYLPMSPRAPRRWVLKPFLGYLGLGGQPEAAWEARKGRGAPGFSRCTTGGGAAHLL